MRVSEIKSELASKGVSTQGLFEKSDFVKLLVQTRLAAPAGGSGGSRNPEFKDVQTKKMPKPESAQTAAGPRAGAAGGSGGPFGGMGGMGGMQNPFAGTGGISLAHLPLSPHTPVPLPPVSPRWTTCVHMRRVSTSNSQVFAHGAVHMVWKRSIDYMNGVHFHFEHCCSR